MVILIDTEKGFENIQQLFMIKKNPNSQQARKIRDVPMFLDLRKDICGKFTINIIVNGERRNAFPEEEEQGKEDHFQHSYPISYWRSQPGQ